MPKLIVDFESGLGVTHDPVEIEITGEETREELEEMASEVFHERFMFSWRVESAEAEAKRRVDEEYAEELSKAHWNDCVKRGLYPAREKP
jgi:hypothetical protein